MTHQTRYIYITQSAYFQSFVEKCTYFDIRAQQIQFKATTPLDIWLNEVV